MAATFNRNEYVIEHGHWPRGYGFWGFVPVEGKLPSELPPDWVAWAHGWYTDAKKTVARQHPGVTEWMVLP